MKPDIEQNSPDSGTALKILDSMLKDPGEKKINEHQIVVILDALASADDIDVVARFPVVLAICARRGLSLNSQTLFSRYWETSPKRQNLEKLLLVSAMIFSSQKLKAPGNLEKITDSLKSKYRNLLSAGEFQLSNGMLVAIADLEKSLIQYLRETKRYQEVEAKAVPEEPARLDIYLDRLFSPKQKELVLKKRDGEAFTKTEREYFSRTVRKKLEAIADEEVYNIARALIVKTGKF
jgi:hypothetical protein